MQGYTIHEVQTDGGLSYHLRHDGAFIDTCNTWRDAAQEIARRIGGRGVQANHCGLWLLLRGEPFLYCPLPRTYCEVTRSERRAEIIASAHLWAENANVPLPPEASLQSARVLGIVA